MNYFNQQIFKILVKTVLVKRIENLEERIHKLLENIE